MNFGFKVSSRSVVLKYLYTCTTRTTKTLYLSFLICITQYFGTTIYKRYKIFHQIFGYITLSHSHPSFYITYNSSDFQSAYIIFVMWRRYIFVLISLLTQVHIFFEETGSRWDLFLLYISVIVYISGRSEKQFVQFSKLLKSCGLVSQNDGYNIIVM